jgi:hypothetical protein
MALTLGQRYRRHRDGRVAIYVGLYESYSEDWRGFERVTHWPILKFAGDNREVVSVAELQADYELLDADVEIEVELTDG